MFKVAQLAVFLLAFGVAVQARADCKEMIDSTRADIKENKEGYTMESRTQANKLLTQAEMKRVNINPLPDTECMAQVRDARKVLRKAKK